MFFYDKCYLNDGSEYPLCHEFSNVITEVEDIWVRQLVSCIARRGNPVQLWK